MTNIINTSLQITDFYRIKLSKTFLRAQALYKNTSGQKNLTETSSRVQGLKRCKQVKWNITSLILHKDNKNNIKLF